MAVKRRFWSAEEKRSICLQASMPGVSVAQVAQRYSMNANLIFKWLRDPRFAPPVSDEAIFLPVDIMASPSIERPQSNGPDAHPGARPEGHLVIAFPGGERIEAAGGYDADALGRLLKAWRS